MHKTTFAVLGGVLLICACITIYIVQTRQGEPIDNQRSEVVVFPTTYISSTTQKTIEIKNEPDGLRMSGAGYRNVFFTLLEGTRFENKDENLLLHIEGENLTLFRGRKILFTGKNQDAFLVAVPTNSTSATTTVLSSSTDEILIEATTTMASSTEQ